MVMAQNSMERSEGDQLGVRGPFDEYETEERTLEMANNFIRRTGLIEYAHIFRIAAELAKRPFGSAPEGRTDYQVDYLKTLHAREEDELERNAARYCEGSNIGMQDARSEPIDTKENRDARRQYEYYRLEREGDKGKLFIYWRQKWRVHALVLCCSLGAAIQGWDESAVNGGRFDMSLR